MKKQLLFLLLTAAFSSKGMSFPQPAQFKELVKTLRTSNDVGKNICHRLLESYRQVRGILTATEQICIDTPTKVGDIEMTFKKTAQDFVTALNGRRPQFKSMNAEHLVTPLIAVLQDLTSGKGDFKARVVKAGKMVDAYMNAAA